EARGALAEAMARDAGGAELQTAAAYADGMSAYLRGRYEEALTHLEHWVDRCAGAPPATGAGALLADAGGGGASFRELAYAAISRLGQLVEGERRERIAERTAALARRLAPLPASAAAGSEA